MESEWFWGLIGLGVLCGGGLVAGLARPWFPRAPSGYRLAAIAAYLVLLVVTGSYVAACPGCTSTLSYDSSRSLELMLAFYWGLPSLLMIFASVWLGQGAAFLARRVASHRRSTGV